MELELIGWPKGKEVSFSEFQAAGWPLTDWQPMVYIIIGYLVTIFTIQRLMKNRERFELKGIVVVHNFFLAALSLVMFLGFVYNLVQLYLASPAPFNDFFCDSERRVSTHPVNIWFYIFYLSKFYELIDTIIIVLKKRPLIFLHVYHHIITMVLVYVTMRTELGIRWISSASNCAVHIPMYTYYGLSALGINVWWKKYITVIQIWQFVLGFFGNSLAYYFYYNNIKCSSTVYDWLFGQAVIFSFLLLFINFFRKTYSERRPRTSTGEAESDTSPDPRRKPKAKKDE
eukprot:TRINITY_DN1836_c0_g1_i1.p1 TRINITY_DN1836_c0_g1~~TRINITY_DN1836_c0_g1_i1.p1  ORF type:complete len:286 (-),score=55.47 TRINITY_DN1836_c0_g1_i1:101-958(-)